MKHPPAWGSKLLPRFKVINGRKFQLHATKGWRGIRKVKEIPDD